MDKKTDERAKEKEDVIKIKLSTLAIIGMACIVIAAIVIGGITLLKNKSSGAAVVNPETKTIEIALVSAPTDCTMCYNASKVVDYIKQMPDVEVKKTYTFEHDSKEAKTLIANYNIKNLPAIIIKGKIQNLSLPGFEPSGKALVYTMANPPYYEIETGKTRGLMSITLLVDNDCTKCTNLSKTVDLLKMYGLGITSEKIIDYKSTKGKELVEKYSIKKVPTLIMTEEAGLYQLITSVWDSIGTIEKDGNYVLRNTTPPYVDVETGSIKGLVTLTLIGDESCNDCYDPELHKNILAFNFGMTFSEEKLFDISDDEGKELVEKYKITKVPTMILTGDLEEYPALKQAWQSVGTIEDDGAYVFRSVELLQGITYKDLETNTEKTSSQPEFAIDETE